MNAKNTPPHQTGGASPKSLLEPDVLIQLYAVVECLKKDEYRTAAVLMLAATQELERLALLQELGHTAAVLRTKGALERRGKGRLV